MEKAKKILAQAKSHVAESRKIVSGSDAAVAESKQSMEHERKTIAAEESAAEGASKSNRISRSVSRSKVNVNRMNFPVVGIGASAGGLEALQSFFEHISSPLGVAFVIVQHLSPDHHSFMGELLSRYTSMPVEFIENGTAIQVNHVYLIPPKVNITIRGGVLFHNAIVGHGLNLPIDIFFRSLAEDQQSNAVAIIMSGAGSDGTLGIRAIKEFGGIAMVQDPRDAKFDGMPKSALSTDMIDLVRSAPDLANELVSYLGHPLFTHPLQTPRWTSDNQTLYSRILTLLKSAKKVDFSSYRKETITRRLEKRISINRFGSLAEYVDYLDKTPQEVDTLFHEILIGVTRFFRDPEAFAELEKNCFPAMFRNRQGSELRIWVASCSTGEEAYSIAILLKDYMLKNRILADVKIFATDIDDRALKFAATGFYPQNVVSDIPPQYLAKYFSPHGSGYQINADIRRMIIFASQDLIDNPPFFKLDLVTCRNFLIYICPEAQQRVLSSFYVGLKTGGFLFLGPSESLEELSKGFDPVAVKEKIFRRLDGYTPKYSPRSPMPLHLSMLEQQRQGGFPEEGTLSHENSELLSILEQIDNYFLHPSLIINANNDIIYAIRDSGKLLHIPVGRVSTNLMKILPKDLALIVSSIIRRSTGRTEIISSEVVMNDQPMVVRCKHIVPENTRASYYYICFEEVQDVKNGVQDCSAVPTDLSNRYQERIDELETAVRQQKESLRLAVEQLETSNEELQASNEELVASNEELQSSNEELQSVNEELYTVNIEHVRKLEEITELSFDYDNLISNTCIGTLFLDDRLVIRKISKIASELTGIMQNDIGRSLSYFSLRKLYARFVKDVERVNATKKMIEKELLLHDKTYCMRIVPYFAEEKTCKGIIVSFVDLTDCKMRAIKEAYASQEKERTSAAQLEAAATIAQMAYFQINTKNRKCTGSQLLPQLWPLRKGGVIPPPEDWILPADLPEVHARFGELLAGKSILVSFRSEFFGDLRYYRLSASLYTNSDGGQFINGVIQNTTQVILTQQRMEAQERLWEDSINAIPVLFYAKDADNDFRYVFANRFFLDFTGKELKDIVGKTDEEITPSGGCYRDEDLRTLESDEALAFENEAVQADGPVRFFHTVKRRNTGADGHRLVLGVGSDVTVQHRMMLDMEAANQCLSALLEFGDEKSVLDKIMRILCARMQAGHCLWMSFDYSSLTTRCEYEVVLPGQGAKLFKKSERKPFRREDDWFKLFERNQMLDIADLAATPESIEILDKYCGGAEKFKGKSLYCVGFRDRNEVLVGSVGFLYSGIRPKIAPERLSYLMSFSANLFRNVLQHKEKSKK